MYQCWTMRSSSMLGRSWLKFCMPVFSIVWTKNFQRPKQGLEKEEEPEIILPNFAGSYRKQGNSRKTSTSISSTTLRALTVWIITNYAKLLKRWAYQTILPVSWETFTLVKKQQSEPCVEQLIGSRSRKEYNRANCCSLVCLTYTLTTPWEISGWMSY